MDEDKVIPIRPDMVARSQVSEPKPLQLGDVYPVIDEQRVKLWEIGSIVENVAVALKAHFGTDWRADIPNFPMALGLAARMINEVTGDLELDTIEERAKRLAEEVVNGNA